MKPLRRIALLLAAAWLAWPMRPVWAAPSQLEAVLALQAAPPGVVFEIAARDPGALDRALPWVAQAAQRLRGKFPRLPLAVVSHGREMFALETGAREDHREAHSLARQLAREQAIPVHVCETHAAWRGVAPEAFPDYVDVAASGPAQVDGYRALGYLLIHVPERP